MVISWCLLWFICIIYFMNNQVFFIISLSIENPQSLTQETVNYMYFLFYGFTKIISFCCCYYFFVRPETLGPLHEKPLTTCLMYLPKCTPLCCISSLILNRNFGVAASIWKCFTFFQFQINAPRLRMKWWS